MFRRRPPLPEDRHDAWWSFVDCVDVLEAGKRQLLATLPKGRVEPAPVGVGLDALAAAIGDAREWMDAWHLDELDEPWGRCDRALAEARAAIPEVRRTAAQPGELDDLIAAVMEVVDPLDAFADAESAWRRRWRLPNDRDRGGV